MRDRIARFLLPMLLVLVLSLPMPAGAEKYMEGEFAGFNIFLDSYGGAMVMETWDCFFGGEPITRYRRHYKIPDSRTMDFEILDIRLDGESMTILDKPDPSRPEGCAAVQWTETGVSVEMYLNASNERHTFEIDYYVQGAVAVYDDVAEFHWNLTSEKEAFDIDAVYSFIEIPYGTVDRGLYFWGHGPKDNGTFEALVNEDSMVNQFELFTENIPKGQGISVRFAMPKELFPDATRVMDGEMLDTVLAEENALSGGGTAVPGETAPPTVTETRPAEPDSPVDHKAMLHERLYWNCFKLSPVFFPVSIVLLVLPLLILVRPCRMAGLYARKKTIPRIYEAIRLKPAQAPEYYRSLPDDMKPAMVHELMTVYPATEEGREALSKGHAFSATVLDLVEEGCLQIGQTGAKDLTFFVTPKASTAELTRYEQNVVELYVTAGAGEAPITARQITEYMRREYAWCKEHYRQFDVLVRDEFRSLALQQLHPEGKCSPIRYGLLGALWGAGTFVGFGMRAYISYNDVSLPIFAAALSGALACLALRKLYRICHPELRYLTQEGEDRYAMWKAYGDFLRDFTLFEEREVPDVKVWRKYLVYATALGCSERVMETLRIHLPQVYESLMRDFSPDMDACRYDDFMNSVASIDQEGGYTIRRTSSSGSSWDSSDRPDGWGGFSDGGGDSDSGSDGSDFD